MLCGVVRSQNERQQRYQDSISRLYVDAAYLKGTLYGLTGHGVLRTWSVSSEDSSEVIASDVAAICLRSSDTLAYITRAGILKSIPSGYKAPQIETEGRVFSLLFDDKGQPVVFSSCGVYYNGNVSFDSSEYHKYNWRDNEWGAADFYTPDMAGNVWAGYDRGEFGGVLEVFSLKRSGFVKEKKEVIAINEDSRYLLPKKKKEKIPSEKQFARMVDRANKKRRKEIATQRLMYSDSLYSIPLHQGYHIKGIASDGHGNYLISNSLMHFFVGGDLTLVAKAKKGNYKFYSLNHLLKYQVSPQGEPELDEYLGPVTYNPYNKNFYYYSNRGFIKLTPDKHGVYSGNLVFSPEIPWHSGSRYSVGYAMNVKKFSFTGTDSFVFVTDTAIGYFDNGKVSYYK